MLMKYQKIIKKLKMAVIGKLKVFFSKNIEIIIISLIFYWYINRFLPFNKGIEYSYFYYLIDYKNGFIKRGFIGEIFRLLDITITSYKIIAINKIIFFILWFLIIQIIKKIFFFNKSLIYLLVTFILLNPALLKNYWIDLGRFDILGAIATCIIILSSKKYSSLLLFFFTIILLLIHEGQLFLFIPSILFTWYLKNKDSFSKNKIYFLMYIFFLVMCTAIISIYGNIKIPFHDFKNSIEERNIEKYKYYFYTNLFTGNTILDIKNSIIFNLTHFRLWVYGTASILYTVYVMSFFLSIYKIRLSQNMYALLTIIGLMNLSMILLGLDGYRWISNTSFAFLLNIFSILVTSENKTEVSTREIFKEERNKSRLVFILLSFFILSQISYIGITSV